MGTPTSHGRGPSRAGEQSRRLLRSIIRSFRLEGNTSPTLDELSSRSGIPKSTVRYHLHYMAERGILALGPFRREITLLIPDEEDGIEAPESCISSGGEEVNGETE